MVPAPKEALREAVWWAARTKIGVGLASRQEKEFG